MITCCVHVAGLFLLPASAIDYQKWFGGDEDMSLVRM